MADEEVVDDDAIELEDEDYLKKNDEDDDEEYDQPKRVTLLSIYIALPNRLFRIMMMEVVFISICTLI